MSYFPAQVILDAEAHAKSVFPKESCGLFVDGAYLPCENYAVDPLKDFSIAPLVYARAEQEPGGVKGVIHSHPNGPVFPSELDMVQQAATNVPWCIIATDGTRCYRPIMWGDALEIPPIIGREFIHGVTDCYSLIRDVFRLGSIELAKQGINQWPYQSITIPDFPRVDNWWSDTVHQNLYMENFGKAGFEVITRASVRPGDVFLCRVYPHGTKTNVVNHAGLVVEGGTILHHLATRPSRRETASHWQALVSHWIRYSDQSKLIEVSK